MKFSGKSIAFGIALVTASIGAVTTAPAQARAQVYVGIGTGYGGYSDIGYRDGFRGDRGGYRGYRGGYRGYNRGGYRDWDRRGWRGNRWQGGYRGNCWTEWRYSRFNGRVPVRICR